MTRAGAAGSEAGNTMTTAGAPGSGLRYSDGIAAARTMLALEGNAAALQRRLPGGWDLAPYAGDDLRGAALWGANLLVPFREVYAVRAREGRPAGLPRLSYVPFLSQARNRATGALAHLHWFTYTDGSRTPRTLRTADARGLSPGPTGCAVPPSNAA
jgi:hypothetical protein